MEGTSSRAMPCVAVQTAVTAGGFMAVVAQTLFIRSFLSVFQGNELVIGGLLACWMVLTACGAAAGSRMQSRTWRRLPEAFVLLGVFPGAGMYLIAAVRGGLLPPGIEAGPLHILATAAMALTPYCILAGAVFPQLVRWAGDAGVRRPIAGVYAFEAAGGSAGGLAFSFMLVRSMSSFQQAGAVACIGMLSAALLAWSSGRKGMSAAGVALAVGAVSLPYITDLDRAARALQFRDQEVVRFIDTPYNAITVARASGQTTVYAAGVPLSTSGDRMRDEEAIHTVMIQRSGITRVLVIGGGLAGAALEVGKYPGAALTYLDIDPALPAVTPMPAGARLDPEIVAEDPRRFLAHHRRFDAIIVRSADPLTAQANRMYTDECFSAMAVAVGDSGVTAISLPPASEYLSPEARRLHGLIYSTMRARFRCVCVAPGLRTWYLASQRPLHADITGRIRQRGIATTYLNPWYVDDALAGARGADLARKIGGETETNADASPRAYLATVAAWLNIFGLHPTAVIGGAVLLLAMAVILIRAASVPVFLSGAQSAGAELLLLLGFQSALGSLYQSVGLLLAAFMAGMYAGAEICRRRPPVSAGRDCIAAMVELGIVVVSIPLFIAAVPVVTDSVVVRTVAYMLVMALVAAAAGGVFASAASLRRDRPETGGGMLYGADLWGAAVGMLCVSSLAIPVLGIASTAVALAALSAPGVLVMKWPAITAAIRGHAGT